jgi:hypothetical protein
MRAATALIVALALIACAGEGQGTTPSRTDAPPPSTSAATDAPEPTATDAAGLTVVSLGDSWPEGAHCGGCRTFAGLYADAIEDSTGESVNFVDLAGDDGTDSAVMLANVRANEPTREALAQADVVVIATGPNEMMSIEETIRLGVCGGGDEADCIRELGETWAENFDAIVAEILEIRAGQPTAIRLVNAANPFFLPEMLDIFGQQPDFASGRGALIFELLTQAACDAADAHGAVCVDVRPIVNGADMDEPGDENAPEVMQAIADALIEIGLPELN